MSCQEKIALLILATSKNRDLWSNIKDSYLFNMTLKSFLLTQNKEHNYLFYVDSVSNTATFNTSLVLVVCVFPANFSMGDVVGGQSWPILGRP